MPTPQKQKVLAVLGPTASGKTALAVQLCRQYGGQVISCDSMQIYREMRIGTARPTPQEMQGIPHHLLDFVSVRQSYSVAAYVQDAAACIKQVAAENQLPVLCGGTGLYAHALLYGLEFSAGGPDEAVRKKWDEIAGNTPSPALYALLAQKDPAAAEKIHPNNVKRIVRALEYMELTGELFSMQESRSKDNPLQYDAKILAIDYRDRQKLYARVDARVRQMLQEGLVQEAKEYFENFGCDAATAAQAIGYKELLPFFRGEISLEQATWNIQLSTRHYAKRQLTWLRKEKEVCWIYGDDPVPLLQQALQQTQPWLCPGTR